MKFNFRKVASVLASVVMLGSTVGIAAAATYPAPFVQNGVANVGIVAGSSAAISDWAALSDIGIDLQKQYAAQTAISGSVSGVSTSGGDAKVLSSSSRKLYYGDNMNDAIQTLTATEMPTVLADGSFSDLSGTRYSYTQTIAIGEANVTFGNSGGDLEDPTLQLDIGNSAALSNGWIYNYTLSFNKNVNVSDATNVQGQKISILGVDYIIGASSTNATLYLYGAGETVNLVQGTPGTATISDTTHSVELVAATDTTQASIKIDGVTKSVVEGSSYAFAGDLNVYVKDITYQAYAGGIQTAELIIGANSLQITGGSTVKTGSESTAIKGTLATITAAGHGIISAVRIDIGAPKSQLDDLAIGGTFTDPVFGALKVTLASAIPNLNSSARGKIVVSTDNQQYAYVTLTSARAGTAGEQKLTYAYDNDTSASVNTPRLAHQSISSNLKGAIHVLEGENARVGDWVVINQGDAGTILSVDDISIDTATTGTVTFSDVITGESQKVTITSASTGGSTNYNKSGVNFYGGTGYTVVANDAGTLVNVTWSGSTTLRTLFPRIKLATGGWLAILAATNVSNDTSIIFPDGLTTLDSTTGDGGRVNLSSSKMISGINWSFDVTELRVNNVNAILNPLCNFTNSKGPAILYIEPKKWNDASYGNFICVPMGGTATTELAVGTPVFNGTNSGFVTLTSDNYKSEAVDQFGSYVSMESRTNENGVATILYPSSQMYLDVVFSAPSTTISGGSAAGGSVAGLGSITVSDAEYSKVSSKNVIVIGGSCINTVAATLLGQTSAVCDADFTTATTVGSGSFLIQSFDNPDATGKVALLVAGYNAEDTKNAAKYLVDQKPDTTVGKKYIGTTATSATLV